MERAREAAAAIAARADACNRQDEHGKDAEGEGAPLADPGPRPRWPQAIEIGAGLALVALPQQSLQGRGTSGEAVLRRRQRAMGDRRVTLEPRASLGPARPSEPPQATPGK